jgi:tetratricopeptide (TPR) repeat protein
MAPIRPAQRERGAFRLVLHAQRGGMAPAPHDIDGLSADAAAADERSVASFREALENDPGEADYLYMLGEALLRLGRAREALPCLEKAVQRHPQEASYHDALGCALWHHRRYDEAATSFQEAVRLAPDHVAALSGLAGVLVDMERPQQAVETLRRAITIDDRDGRLYTNLAVAHWCLGDDEDAQHAFRRAARLRPNSAAVQRNLGYALLEAGERDNAFCAFRDAIALRPEDAQARADLGDALYGVGRKREAEEAYAEAARLDPQCLTQRETSRKARAAMLGAQLRDELRSEEEAPSLQERGFRAILASRPAARALAALGGGSARAVLVLLAVVALRAAWAFVPPHVSHYLLQDDVTEIARAPVRSDADVLDRLQHAVEKRGLASYVDPRSFEIATRPKWRRITGDYTMPMRLFPGLSTNLHFHVAAEEPYILFDHDERGRLVIPDEK